MIPLLTPRRHRIRGDSGLARGLVAGQVLTGGNQGRRAGWNRRGDEGGRGGLVFERGGRRYTDALGLRKILQKGGLA